jgi:hypothetical protein
VRRKGNGIDKYTLCCTRYERSGLTWFKSCSWKLGGIRKGSEKGKFPPCRENKDAAHLSLKCSKTRTGRNSVSAENFLCLIMEKIITITNCTNIIKLRNTAMYLYNIRCKWENNIRILSPEVGRGE